MRQAAWLFDIQIAAVAFAAGLDVATRNIRDFEVLSASLERRLPRRTDAGCLPRLSLGVHLVAAGQGAGLFPDRVEPGLIDDRLGDRATGPLCWASVEEVLPWSSAA